MPNNPKREEHPEFLCLYVEVFKGSFEESIIPYHTITGITFGKELLGEYPPFRSGERDMLTIYHAPVGNGRTFVYGDYARKVYKHLTGVSGLGIIYRIQREGVHDAGSD